MEIIITGSNCRTASISTEIVIADNGGFMLGKCAIIQTTVPNPEIRHVLTSIGIELVEVYT